MRFIKKLALGLIALLIIGAVVSQVFKAPIGERLYDRVIARQLSKPPAMTTLPDGLHVLLIGSGSPQNDPTRMGPSTLVVAGSRIFVVDVGSGSVRNYRPFGIPAGRIDALFLTHFHSDHIDGMGELMLQRWANGQRNEPLPVYGPQGVEQVVDGFNQAYAHDKTYRVAHHGEEIVPPSGHGGQGLPFDGSGITVLIDDIDLKVTAFPVAHDPVDPAVGYRFDYKGRSVTLSGDTAYSESLIANAKGTDILISEALNADMVKKMEEATREAGIDNITKILSDIPTYHVTPVEAAQMAKAAGADMLVYNHIVPVLPTPYLNAYFTKGVDAVFGGPVIVGQDGLLFSLVSNGEEIDLAKLP